jgi:hypothetical protein
LVRITIAPADVSNDDIPKSAVLETSSMIKVDPHIIPEIAESDDILFDNEK